MQGRQNAAMKKREKKNGSITMALGTNNKKKKKTKAHGFNFIMFNVHAWQQFQQQHQQQKI